MSIEINTGLLLPAGVINKQLKAGEKNVTPESFKIKRFSKEAREKLEKMENVYIWTGESVGKSVLEYSFTWNEEFPGLETLTPMGSEVAVDLKKFFLDDSNNNSLSAQMKMIEKSSKELGILGIKKAMLSLPDYLNLASSLKFMENKHLFKLGDSRLARTATPWVRGKDVACVGQLNLNEILHIGHWDPKRGHPDVFAAAVMLPE